jgi:hypothetical protein
MPMMIINANMFVYCTASLVNAQMYDRWANKNAANPAMKGWGERNGIDAEFDAKRISGIQAAQPKRAEKMRDPVALAQRKERLKATLNSPEYKAKRAIWDTPEYRAKLSENKKSYWATKKRECLFCR